MSFNPMDVSHHAQARIDQYREETRLAGLRNASTPSARERLASALHALALSLDALAGRLSPRQVTRVRHTHR